MKYVVCLVTLVSMVFSATLTHEKKRELQMSIDAIRKACLAALGSDVTEHGCKTCCYGLFHGLDFAPCAQACYRIQDYVQQQG